jgi:O-antigen/teichoic acid export membrane protein
VKGASTFLLLPLYTRYLSPDEFGTVSIVVSFTLVVSILFSLGLESAIARFYYEFNNTELKVFNGTIVIFVMAFGIVGGIILILFKNALVIPLIRGVDFIPYMLLGVLTAAVKQVYVIYIVMLQIRQKALSYALNNLSNFGLTIILTVVFLTIFHQKATGLLLANFIVALVFFAYSIVRMRMSGYISFVFIRRHFSKALKYSIPIIPHNLSYNISVLLSKSILNANTSISNVGLFDIASQFGIIVDTAQQAVNQAYVPWFYQSLKNDDKLSVIKLSDLLMKLYGGLCIALALFAREAVAAVAAPSYRSAWLLVPIIAIAYQIKGAYYFYVNALFYNLKGVKYILIGSIGANILNALLNAILIINLGLFTPAISFLISNVALVLIISLISWKIEPISFNVTGMVAQLMFGIIVIIGGLFFDHSLSGESFSVAGIVFKLFLVLGVFILFFYKDRNAIRGFLISLFRRIVRQGSDIHNQTSGSD